MYGAPVRIDLTVKGVKQYNFPACNRLWLAKKFCDTSGDVQTNPTDAVLGIQVGSMDAQMHPWSIQDGFVLNVSGMMKVIFVTVLTKGASDSLSLMTGTSVGVGYGNPDGLSPQVSEGDSVGSAQNESPIDRRIYAGVSL